MCKRVVRANLGRVIAVVLSLWAALPVMAQQESDLEVQVRVTRVGPANAAREGDWSGIRVELTDRGLAPQRDLVLRVRSVDPDGDEVHYDRIVTSNANLPQSFWLYAVLPASSRRDFLDVLAYEAVENSSGGDRIGFRTGRLLGRAEAPLQRVLPGHRGMIGVVGPFRFGLDDYGPTGNFTSFLPQGHEMTAIVAGMDIMDIPDRWQGLASLSVLVWGTTREQTNPGNLSPDKAQAVREWVERGGHLIVVLPSIGQEWFSAAGNPLASLMPRIEPPTTQEGVDLRRYRALLTYDKEAVLPSSALVRTFRASADALAHEAMPILVGPDNECVVIRRLIGCGAVTVIGIDLGSAGLRNLGLPRAEIFWHRVLGRRGELNTSDQIAASGTLAPGVRMETRSFVHLDIDVPEQIAKTGTAAFGVGLGVLVFVAYWLVAGPIGYMLLSKRGMKQHAWLAFAGSIVLFTGVAWAGASLARPQRAVVRHVTIAMAVHGQEVQRARSWMALLVPYYGDGVVSLAQGEGTRDSNLMSPFEAPGSSVGLARFPDNRPYRVEARAPSQLMFPARSTVKEIAVEWAGRTDWRLPEPIGEPGDLEEPRLRLVGEDEFDASGVRLNYEIAGVIAHGLPSALEDVVILVNRGQVSLIDGGRPGRQLTGNVFAYELAGPWAPNSRLLMPDVTRRGESDAVQRRQLAFVYLQQLLEGERIAATGTTRPDSRRFSERLKSLALFSQLEPPRFEGTGAGVGDRLARRSLTHGFDLGMWFTQPSVIVIGQIQESGRSGTSLVPVMLDGQRVPSEGRTLLMWVYPLEANPPRIRASGEAG